MTFFDSSVGTYVLAAESRNFRARTQAFAAAARLAAKRTEAAPVCVDLGTGTGYLGRAFISQGFRLIGCDSSPEMLKVAATSLPDAELHLADVVEFLQGLSAQSADLVVCSSVLEYLPDPLAIIRLAAPILREDGILAVSLPLRFSVSRFAQAVMMRRVPKTERYATQWRNNISGRELVAEAEHAGLRLLYRQLFGSLEWRRLRLPFERHRPVATLGLYVFQRA